jgi:putative acetyltransferase
MIIRPEKSADIAGISEVVAAAFGGRAEADLVQRLRDSGDLVLSLVAEDDGAIVGHVAFSRLWIEGDGTRFPAIGLAPVSVLPERRRKGTARALIGAGHLRLKTLGEKIVFVVGDPDYYKRFGFSRETAKVYDCVYQGDDMQALRLSGDVSGAGEVVYPPAFVGLE